MSAKKWSVIVGVDGLTSDERVILKALVDSDGGLLNSEIREKVKDELGTLSADRTYRHLMRLFGLGLVDAEERTDAGGKDHRAKLWKPTVPGMLVLRGKGKQAEEVPEEQTFREEEEEWQGSVVKAQAVEEPEEFPSTLEEASVRLSALLEAQVDQVTFRTAVGELLDTLDIPGDADMTRRVRRAVKQAEKLKQLLVLLGSHGQR